MRDRQSIIGFTEAELGLFAAILLLIFSIHPVSRPIRPPDRERPIPQDRTTPSIGAFQKLSQQNKDLLQGKDQTDKQNIDLSEENRRLQQEIDKLKGLKSRQRPACTEKGLATGFLFGVTIVGADNFRIGDSTFDLAGLLRQFGPQLSAAAKAGCVQSIRAYYDRDLSLDDSIEARKALQLHFYLAEGGEAPN